MRAGGRSPGSGRPGLGRAAASRSALRPPPPATAPIRPNACAARCRDAGQGRRDCGVDEVDHRGVGLGWACARARLASAPVVFDPHARGLERRGRGARPSHAGEREAGAEISMTCPGRPCAQLWLQRSISTPCAAALHPIFGPQLPVNVRLRVGPPSDQAHGRMERPNRPARPWTRLADRPGPHAPAAGRGLRLRRARGHGPGSGRPGRRAAGTAAGARRGDGLRDAAGGNRPLKAVAGRLEAPPLPAKALAFVDWAARYAVSHPASRWRSRCAACGAPKARPERVLVATGMAPARPTPARARVLAAGDPSAGPRRELARAAGVCAGVVARSDRRRRAGRASASTDRRRRREPEPDHARPTLNPSQAAAADRARGDDRRAGGFAVALLDGVTGSGKTEVYLEAAAAVLRRDPDGPGPDPAAGDRPDPGGDRPHRRALRRPPAEWHSGVAAGAAAAGLGGGGDSARPRSSSARARRCSCRSPQLGLIVVDEEHDASYKQEDGFIYQARDLAVARGKIDEAPVVLASATPSLETLWNAQAGRYRWLQARRRATAARCCREVTLVDLRETPPESGRWLSPPLVTAMRETLARGEQALLFLNRRGYAPLVLCRACGERLKAPDTESWLVEHRYSGRLVCHLTGFSMPKPGRCPYCGARRAWSRSGRASSGSRRRRARCFPRRALAVFSSDTVADAPRRAAADRGDDRRRDRHPGRHPGGGQGPQLPQPDPGRRGRRGPRPARRRPARRRAHLPAAGPGGRPRGPQGSARAGRCCRPGRRSIR